MKKIKMLKNKIITSTIAFAIIIALILSFSLIGQIDFNKNDSYSETFSGSISESSYSSKEAAARAFVSRELSGQGATYEYTGYTKTGDLTKSELTEINAKNTLDEAIQSGEKVKIGYRNTQANNNVRAYLLETAQYCRYYVLPPEDGEPVTNTYLDSVLDGANYLNCTSTTTVGLSILDMMTTYMQVIKFDDDKVYFKQELPGLISDVYLEESAGVLTAYIEHPEIHDGKFYALSEIKSYYAKMNLIYELYLKKGGEKILIDSLNSIRDVTDFAFMLNVDASFFVKKNYGFSMTDNNFKAFCKAFASDAMGDTLDQVWEDYKLYFRSDYYVSDGRLSKSETILRLLYEDKFMTLSVVSLYSDFGTTEVVIPDRC